MQPREREMDAMREAGLFAYAMDDDTYDVASKVHDLLVKTHPANVAKIEEIKRLVTEHFDVDQLLERLDGLEQAAGWVGDGAAAGRLPVSGSGDGSQPRGRAGWLLDGVRARAARLGLGGRGRG